MVSIAIRRPNRRADVRMRVSQTLLGMTHRYSPGAEPACCPRQGERLVPYQNHLICSRCGTDPRNPQWTPARPAQT